MATRNERATTLVVQFYSDDVKHFFPFPCSLCRTGPALLCRLCFMYMFVLDWLDWPYVCDAGGGERGDALSRILLPHSWLFLNLIYCEVEVVAV